MNIILLQGLTFVAMKYFLIAGEASGDLHGSHLIKAIKSIDNTSTFQFWGGDKMAAESDGLVVHYKDVTIMGFVEVLMNLRTISNNLKLCKQQILEFKPDVVVCIDYPGFNLRIAEFCKKHQIRVVYYIAPKVWAWKENRVKKLEKFVDDLLLIFPFEVSYFKKWKVKSTYVGNPLLDELSHFKLDIQFKQKNKLDQQSIIALMPGSRKQEIKRMLPIMIEATKSYKNHQLVIAGAPGIDPTYYNQFLNDRLHIVFNQTYQLLKHSDAAIVCSGTATLETALLNVPQVCGYAGSPLSYMIAKLLVSVKYISLVNLCMEKEVIKELIQNEVNAKQLQVELDKIMPGGENRERMLADYNKLQTIMGGEGASVNAAKIIYKKN